jgi:tetratricopeptide (TPR) repeat protein
VPPANEDATEQAEAPTEASEGAVAEAEDKEEVPAADTELAEEEAEEAEADSEQGTQEAEGETVAASDDEAATEAEGEPTSAGVNPRRGFDSVIEEAEVLARRGDMDRAAPLFVRAYEIRPGDNHAVAGMARVYIARGDVDNALRFARRAVAKRKRRAAYRVILGDAHMLAGDREAARLAYRQALFIDRDYVHARERLAELEE